MIALPLCVAAAAFIVAVGLPSRDPDMWWHLATGRWMIEHGELLRVDIFSSTATGRPYEVGEWLGQLAMAAVHGAFGWPGLAVLRALLVAIAAFALARVALRAADAVSSAPSPNLRRAVALAITALALVLSSVAWTDRPQLVSIALFPVLLDLLFMARDGSRRALYAVVPLLFVWSDLHGGYALGLVVLAVFALDAVLTRRDARFALIAALGFAVVLLNPGAIGVLPATAHVATAPRIIVEESPPDVLTPAGALFGAFAVAVLAAFLLRGASLLAVLLLVPLLWLAFSAQRHMVWFAFAAVPFLTDAGVEAVRAWYGLRGGRDPLQRRRLAPGIAAVLTLAAIASIPLTAPTTPDESVYPVDAIEPLRASGGILINEYDWGGYLIWSAPERPVFIDGRLKPFQPDVLDEHLRVTLLRPRWREILDHYAVRQALLDPERPLAGALREDGWRVLVERDGYVLLERPQ